MDISRLFADRSFRLCGYTDAKARVSIIMNLIILSFFPQIFAKYGSETATGWPFFVEAKSVFSGT